MVGWVALSNSTLDAPWHRIQCQKSKAMIVACDLSSMHVFVAQMTSIHCGLKQYFSETREI